MIRTLAFIACFAFLSLNLRAEEISTNHTVIQEQVMKSLLFFTFVGNQGYIHENFDFKNPGKAVILQIWNLAHGIWGYMIPLESTLSLGALGISTIVLYGLNHANAEGR
jgi:hypothetical protein